MKVVKISSLKGIERKSKFEDLIKQLRKIKKDEAIVLNSSEVDSNYLQGSLYRVAEQNHMTVSIQRQSDGTVAVYRKFKR
jgi:hypothetical protein